MTAITSATPTRATGAAAATPGIAPATPAEGEDRFLKMLVAQMRNQDPLNPLDNAQVTSQMAQLSTVSGIDKLNATMKTLLSGFGDTQSLQASALIGHDVLVTGNTLGLDGGSAHGGFDLKEAADRVTMEIRDAAGNVVHRADLGAQPAGVHTFAWDGANDAGAAMPAGTYVFSVSAVRANTSVAADALSAARVIAVSRDADGTNLELSGIGARRYADVKQIL